jgi:hypothetical protein
MPSIESDFLAELAQIQAESIGWISLGEGVYLHVADEKATEIEVVGLARSDMQSSNVVWVV